MAVLPVTLIFTKTCFLVHSDWIEYGTVTSFDFLSGEGSAEDAFTRNWAISRFKVSNAV